MKRILLLSLLLLPIVVLAQYPTFSNKQKLGVQTTGDGLIFRGTTINNIPNYTPSNVNNAYFHLDTTTNKLYLYNDGWQQVYPTAFDTSSLNIYLKISDTTAMLLPYFRDSDTTSLNLINRFALKLNISDTVTMLTPYMKKADTISLSNRINLKLNISDTTILSNRITTNANNIITINNKLATKLDTIYTKFKNVVKMIVNKDTINIGSSLTDGYAINIIGDSVNVDTTLLDIRYPDRDSTNELQDITFATTAGIVTISGGKVINLDTLYNSVIDSVNLLIRDSIAAFTPLTEGYGINIIGDSINVDTSIIFTQSDTITLSNRINLKLNKSDTISLSNRINTKLDTIYVNYQTSIDTIVNKDTINITTLEAGAGINITNNVISLDTTLLDSVVRVQNVYVKNGTGTVLNKGEAVYVTGANGTNIIVGRASNVAESSSSKTLGLTMTSIAIDGFGYVVKEGLLAGLNTSAADSAGVPIWLGVNGALIYGLTNKPYAPNHLVYLGVVTRKNPNVGEVYVTVQNGFEIKELHDVQISDPVNKASLYYNSSQSLWRDTTPTLLVSDTANMLNPYFRKLDTISLSNRIDLRVKYADTTNMLLPYFRTNDTTLLNLNSRLSIKLNLSDTASMLSKYVNTYSNQTEINGNKTFNNVITIDSATVIGKLLVNTNISDAVKINSNTNSTNLELMNSGGSVYIKSSNKNMTLQTDNTALMYLNGENNKVGILTMTPEQALEVAGTIRVDSLINSLTPDKLVGANNANDLTDIKIGNGLSFLNDTLKIDDNIINSGDTATLLRKDYIVGSNGIVIWTEGNKKLIPYFTQVYRNGQLLKSTQYTITADSVVTLNSDSYKIANIITIIAIDNIVALAGSGEVITLQGDVTGSGTSSITTTIGANKVTNTMLAGSISDNKLNTITTVGKVSNSATTATNLNTNNAIVSRDGSGNFSAGTITASLNGNANTSTTLATGRTIAITGDLTYTSPSFNGSTNVTAVGTLANSGVTANTYTAATVTVDAKGRITSASSNTIPTVNNETLTMAVSGNGLTGSQTFTANQSSAATFTVTSNATNNNTANTVVYRDANGNFSAGSITASNFYGLASTATISNGVQSLLTTGIIKLATVSNAVQPTITVPDVNAIMARTDAAQTFTGTQTFSSTISGSIDGNASTATNVAYSGLTGVVPIWNQNTTGNAATVTTNANLTGDVTSTGNSTTLASVGTAGTYRSVTTDIKGRVTAGTNPTTLSGYGITDAVSSNRTITINGTAQDLSINRTFNVGTVTSVGGTGNVSGLTLTGTVSSTGNLTLGGALSLTSGNVTTALGYTPYNNTNPNSYISRTGLSFVAGSGAYDNTTGVITIPTNNNQITNGAGYITSSSLSSYLPLSGGTLTGDLYLKYLNTFAKTTYIPFNTGIGEQSIFNVGTVLRGGTVMVFPDSNLVGSSANIFLANSSVQGVESSAMGSGIRNYSKQGGDNRRNSLAFYTSGIGSQNTNRLFIDYDGNVGINDDTPSYKLEVNGTLGVTGVATFSNTSRFIGNVAINTTTAYKPVEAWSNANDFISLGVRSLNTGQFSGIHFGYVEPSTDYRKSAIVFQRRDYTGGADASGSIHLLNVTQGQGGRSVNLSDAKITIFNNGNVGINDTTPSFNLDITGTLNATGATTLGSTLVVTGAVTLSTTSATPTTLLGKDGSNVVGTVTTVAQTGLMTRGETTATTGSPSATFTVTHGLGSTPTSVLVTSAGIGGGDKIIFEVYTKNSTTFSVQAWNYDGTEASGKEVKIYWLALK